MQPGGLVAIAMERCTEMVVCLIAILKAGGCYVPIDPLGPRERQAFMMEDTGASILLTQSHLATRLSNNDVNALCLDSDWDTIEQNESARLPNISTLKTRHT